MSNDSLRARLEALNRGPLPSSHAVNRDAANIVEGARTARQVAAEPPKSHAASQSHVASCPIGGLLDSGEVVETQFGPHLRIDLPVERLWAGGPKLISARQELLRSQLALATAAVEPTIVFDAEFATLVSALPDRAVALDLETCGLAGSALFLIGLLRQASGFPQVQLLLARNYGEEAAVLASMWQIVAENDVLVTFNGKSFDWPMVVERSIRHRLPPPVPPEHCLHIDILHHARRRWRKRLPDCRLKTLEQYVCRRKREADIPGHAIPGVYADYVRTGFAREMDRVLYHNALDLVTLVDLAHRLAA